MTIELTAVEQHLREAQVGGEGGKEPAATEEDLALGFVLSGEELRSSAQLARAVACVERGDVSLHRRRCMKARRAHAERREDLVREVAVERFLRDDLDDSA